MVGVFGASKQRLTAAAFFRVLTALAVTAGWRVGAVVLGAIALILVVPVLIRLRNDPAEVGARPRGAPEGEPAPARRPVPGSCDEPSARPTSGSSPARSSSAARRRRSGRPALHPARGGPRVHGGAASGALAVMGVFNFIGTIGRASDGPVDPRKLLLVYYGFRGVSLLFLPFVTTR